MRKLFIFIIAGLVACSQKQNEENPPQRPNVLLIVADDLGFSDIGPFGGNIHTPVLDQFSKQGMLFSNFLRVADLFPTRSAVLQGNDNSVAGVGIMSEVKYPAVANLPGYSGHLNDQVVTLPEILREHGYHTYMAGKWHLGDENGQIPSDRGFEESFTLQGGEVTMPIKSHCRHHK
ncbi:MAG: sulfatase-like hydrolase/transferase [Flammeovirgaceae bacterium]|nr:sulfatase-like hydrolase/transferase [Flammeovirgaceae bacterium]